MIQIVAAHPQLRDGDRRAELHHARREGSGALERHRESACAPGDELADLLHLGELESPRLVDALAHLPKRNRSSSIWLSINSGTARAALSSRMSAFTFASFDAAARSRFANARFTTEVAS